MSERQSGAKGMRALTLFACALAVGGCASTPPVPGRLVDVGGRKMHLNCSGPEQSSPTIVVEGGLSGLSPFYSQLHLALESKIRICTYDRAGLGWSEPGTSSRDA